MSITDAPKYNNVLEYGAAILHTNEMSTKVQLTHEAYNQYKKGKIVMQHDDLIPSIPDVCARPTNLQVVYPEETSTKVKGDPQQTRLKLLHSQAHIESYAIDLSWDILVRFAGTEGRTGAAVDRGVPTGTAQPEEFFADWLQVAEEEANHFSMWEQRLRDLGCHYGAFPCHDGLWESVLDTRFDLLARLAIVHCVHEAHGLDVGHRLLNLFRGQGDKISVEHMRIIHEEEVGHVLAGVKWFKYISAKQNKEPIPLFHEKVQQNWNGRIKPPFNHEMRERAGMTKEWYEPLVGLSYNGKANDQQRLDVHKIMEERRKKKMAQDLQQSCE